MRLVTTDPDTYVIGNTAAGGGLAALAMIVVAPPLIVPVAIAAVASRLLQSWHWHPLLVALGTAAATVAPMLLVIALLRAMPIRAGAAAVAVYVATCYFLASLRGFGLDAIWSGGIAVLTGWLGWTIGARMASALHARRRPR